MQDFHYTGIDYSVPIIEKHKILFPHHEVYVSEANKLSFESFSYDWVFCFGLFQYLENYEYAERVISEMKRVAKKGIFIGDLKTKPTRKEHFVYSMNKLISENFKISECLYDSNDVERFNAYYKKEAL